MRRQTVGRRCINLSTIKNGSFFGSSGLAVVIAAVLVILAPLQNDDSARIAAAFSLAGRTAKTSSASKTTLFLVEHRTRIIKDTSEFSCSSRRRDDACGIYISKGRTDDKLKLFAAKSDNNENNQLETKETHRMEDREERRKNEDESNNNNNNKPTNFSNRNNGSFFFLPTLANPVDRIQDVQLLMFDVFLILNLTLSASFWVVYRLDVLKTMTIALNEGCIFASCWIISGIINNAFGGEDANDESSLTSSSSSSSDDLFTPKDPLLSKAISTFVMASILRLGLALLAFAMASGDVGYTAGITSSIEPTTIVPTADSLMSVVNQATESPSLTFQTTSTTTSSSPAMMLSEIGGLRDDQAAKLVPLELGVGAVLMTTWRMLHAQMKRY